MRMGCQVIGIVLLLAAAVRGGDWPQWRGPEGDGSSSEVNLPLQWGPTENIAWKVPMPAWSGATPIVWGDTIFLNAAEGGKRTPPGHGRRRGAAGPPEPVSTEAPDPRAQDLSLWCLDRRSGEVRWKRSLGGGNRQQMKQNMSSPSPVTDGSHVWVMTGTGVLKAFDFQGNEKWSRNVQQDYGEFGLMWGYASSPLLYDGTLYVQVLHGMKTDDASYLLGLDPATGATKWQVERPTDAVAESPDSYTTPAVLGSGDQAQIVVSGGDYVTGHEPATGKEIWRAGGLNPNKARNYRIIASPLVSGDLIYVSTRKNPFLAFRWTGEGVREVWQMEDGPDVPTPVTDGTYLYVLRDNGVMLCLEADTGKVVWGPERVRPGTYCASPVLADGRIYVTSEDGVTSVVAAGPEFKLLAENELEGYTLASPAISNRQIFIRTEQFLYCIGTRS